MRSGQPLSGTTGKRCKEDERLLNSVLGPGRRGFVERKKNRKKQLLNQISLN